jgi:hypothetical protein
MSEYYKKLESALANCRSEKQLYEAIVNTPFIEKHRTTAFGLGFLSLVLVDKKAGTINRISISNTDTAKGAINITVVPFEKLIVPVGYKGNIVAEAIRVGRPQQTSDWKTLLVPVLKPEEARLNQAGAGIAASFVYPLVGYRDGGAIIFQYFVPIDRVGREQHEFMFRYTKLVSRILKGNDGKN